MSAHRHPQTRDERRHRDVTKAARRRTRHQPCAPGCEWCLHTLQFNLIRERARDKDDSPDV